MVRPIKITYTPANPDTDGLVDGATGATSPVTQLATSAGDGLAHRLNITSGNNISALTITITGTDENGVAQTEDVTGPNATTVESTKYFLTVTSVAISATLGSNTMDVGWVDEFVTPTVPFDYHVDDVAVRVVVGGTINYSVNKTFGDIYKASTVALEWSDVTDPAGLIDMTSITASVERGFDPIPTGLRLKANSYSNGATLDLYVVHQ